MLGLTLDAEQGDANEPHGLLATAADAIEREHGVPIDLLLSSITRSISRCNN
jgi:hypothetical protein